MFPRQRRVGSSWGLLHGMGADRSAGVCSCLPLNTVGSICYTFAASLVSRAGGGLPEAGLTHLPGSYLGFYALRLLFPPAPDISMRHRNAQKKAERAAIASTLPDRLLSESEVAAMLGISRVTLWRMRQREEGPRFIKISPGRIGARLSDVLRWMDNRC